MQQELHPIQKKPRVIRDMEHEAESSRLERGRSHAARTGGQHVRMGKIRLIFARGLRQAHNDGRVLGGAASTTSGHQPVMKYSVLHAQPVS